MKSMIRLRMSSHDAHYGGNLVDGARMLGLFGDVATELCILHDGDDSGYGGGGGGLVNSLGPMLAETKGCGR